MENSLAVPTYVAQKGLAGGFWKRLPPPPPTPLQNEDSFRKKPDWDIVGGITLGGCVTTCVGSVRLETARLPWRTLTGT